MPVTVHNPIVPGWHADPEARFYEGRFWIYATRSLNYDEQRNQDVFSSADLAHWEKHEDIIDMADFPWARRAVWAPTVIEKDGKYYLIFATNDIQSDDMEGGLEIAVADNPAGPFRGYLGRPLIDRFIHGAQPIDAHLFRDDDGTVYLFYGGWGHCNVAVMNDEMTGFVPFSDGETFREITPENYVEGPCMFKRGGIYYFLYSTGAWTTGSYAAEYATAPTPCGPFTYGGRILSSQEGVANGPGHNGYFYLPERDLWLMVYHRHPLEETEGNARMLCIDRMDFDGDAIRPVVMTHEWALPEK